MRKTTKNWCILTITFTILALLNNCGEAEEPAIENTDPKIINALEDVNLEEGFGTSEISFANVFSDDDNDQLTITISNSNPLIVTITESANSITLTEVGVGTTTITIKAEDGNGGSVTDNFMIAVNAKSNTAPAVKDPLLDEALDEGFSTSEIDISSVFEDSDGDDLSLTASSSDESVVTVIINENSLILTEIGVGTTTIKLTADDGNGGMISDEITVTVNAAANNAPVIANAISDLTLDEGFDKQTVDITNTFEDQDNDALNYSLTSSDESVATVSLTGTVITLSEIGNGTTSISVKAEDGNGGSVEDTFEVTVNASTNESVSITFGTNTGNSISINDWTTLSNANGYALVISDASSISNLTDGTEPLSSTTYIGTGEQVIYFGTNIGSMEITLLEDVKTYYFKVIPYAGNFVYDNTQAEQESSTLSCSISSTTESEVCFEISGDIRTITSNQYPSHAVGNFPNADPTAITTTRSIDLTPQAASSITYLYDETGPPTPNNKNFWQFGIATNGVEFHPMGLKPWTNPTSGEENWEWQAKVAFEGETHLDAYGAHVTSQGNYHYHGATSALASKEDGTKHSLLYGYAADGFPIYYKYGYVTANDPTSGIKELLTSHQLKSGSRSDTGTAGTDYPDGSYDGFYIQDYEYSNTLGDLDECNGRTGVTPEYPDGTYYYVITTGFPVVPNCFYGTPDTDWQIGN